MTDDGAAHEHLSGRERVRFPGISSRAWEHPADRSALVALRKLTGFDTVFKALSGMLPERSLRLLFLSDSVRVDERQFPHLHQMLLDACYVLDLERVPPMYVTQDPKPNAMCVGLDQPLIVLTSGLVELLDEDEMRAAIGHEVGHALSGHAVYRTILLFLTSVAVRVAWIPLGNLAVTAIVSALREWFRKSELSADRAGLLVSQDPQAGLRVLMKLAGGNHLHEMNTDAFLEQAEEYERGGDLRDSVLKILNVLPRTHPFAAVRAAELHRWSQGRDYQRILEGHYPRRDEDGGVSVSGSVKESAGHYARTVKESTDPLMRLVSDVASGAGELGGKLRDLATGRVRPPRQRGSGHGGGSGNGSGNGDGDGDGGSAAANERPDPEGR
ncbi:M48 family metallopeptidase [Streptomyces sp. 7-21]|uniref:M48 family metallopeptidase n=1 Tax=Streptomyces sp. 7-21 TaxID=2802283 RepID=UPI00191DE1C5|nr:M48 family metallopeptidase [Streptomyces sp. 7-21]MBL1067805.1 M48 family metallopeptidase [Streptomyces sp. 7-21]